MRRFAREEEGWKRSKEQDGEENQTCGVLMFRTERRRGALEAQHWFSSVHQTIRLLHSLKYNGGD